MEIIQVIVKTRKSLERVEEKDGVLIIYVNKPPQRNMANKRVIELLSEYYSTRKNSIRIISGIKSKRKKIAIEDI